MQRMTYLIDSENVNDAWVKLLPTLEKRDRIIIFYTENSPHFTVDSARVITEHKDKDVTWKKCFAGKNALDFQLVSQMGFLIGKYPQDGYAIMSNDTGFDAVAKFWLQEGVSVSRIRGNGKAVTGSLAEAVKERHQPEKPIGSQASGQKQPGKENAFKDRQPPEKSFGVKSWFSRWFSNEPESTKTEIHGESVEEALASEEKQKPEAGRKNTRYSQRPRGGFSQGIPASADMAKRRLRTGEGESVNRAEIKESVSRTETKTKEPVSPTEPKEPQEERKQEVPVGAVISLCRSIPIRKQERIHEALVALLGGENGKEVYHFLKENKEFHERLTTIYLVDKNARIDNYLQVVFGYHNIRPQQMEDIVRLLNKYSSRDLNGLYKALTGCFGKSRGSQYYSVLKPHVRVIKKL